MKTTLHVRAIIAGALLALALTVGLDALSGGLESGDLDYPRGFVTGLACCLWLAWINRDRDALTKPPDGPVR